MFLKAAVEQTLCRRGIGGGGGVRCMFWLVLVLSDYVNELGWREPSG